MGIHKTNYKTENGKTRKVKQPAKSASKNGAPDNTGADNKNRQPDNPAK
jgi:hypothetical protein